MKDLLLDTQIRTWVFLPIVLITFFIELLKYYIGILFEKDKKDIDLEDVKFNHIQKRANILKDNYGYITKQAFELRKQMLNPETGYLKIQPKTPSIMSSNMADNHSNMMNHFQNQAVNIFPMILAGAFVSYCFSGFITTKVPIPLTLAFKQMLQRDIELSCLNPQWVSSISWYFLNLFGLKSMLSLLVCEYSDSTYENEMMRQLTSQKHDSNNQELWESLEIIKHKFLIVTEV